MSWQGEYDFNGFKLRFIFTTKVLLELRYLAIEEMDLLPQLVIYYKVLRIALWRLSIHIQLQRTKNGIILLACQDM